MASQMVQGGGVEGMGEYLVGAESKVRVGVVLLRGGAGKHGGGE